jgi:hypothetical protein
MPAYRIRDITNRVALPGQKRYGLPGSFDKVFTIY